MSMVIAYGEALQNRAPPLIDVSAVGLDSVDVVALNQDAKANLGKKIGFTLARRPDLKLVLDRIRNKRERAGVAELLKAAFPDQSFKGKVVPVEHHLAHLSSAFHVSPHDEAVVVLVDGFGDFASGAWGEGRGTDIDVSGRVYFPHSLGIFYQALTQFLGFPHYGDEYKVMGLAPYGKPTFMDEMRQIVGLEEDGGYRLNLDYFRHHKEKVEYEWEDGSPTVGRLFSEALEELLGPARKADEPLEQRHKDIAHSIQAMYEEAFFHLLNHLHAQYGHDALCLAGGCAMNSVANGKVRRNTPFKQVYIQSAGGDAGGAIGAAFVAWHGLSPSPRPSPLHGACRKTPSPLRERVGERVKNNSLPPRPNPLPGEERGIATASQGERARRPFVMDHAYWGPGFDNDQIASVLEQQREAIEAAACQVALIDEEEEVCRRTASAIADGAVVGWFQGRMEWGPRALGNRSIVCDPRRADMKDILNLKIKRRESFRPFAPSILREAVAEWFEEDDDVPFMMKVFQIREDRRERIPAVTQVDGSGRLQTVYRDTNPRYHRLIESFNELTGVPIVLNTSFNENEPVVCRPEEALDCFLRTKMDVLVLGNWYIWRE